MDRGELIAATLGDGAYRALIAPGNEPALGLTEPR